MLLLVFEWSFWSVELVIAVGSSREFEVELAALARRYLPFTILLQKMEANC